MPLLAQGQSYVEKEIRIPWVKAAPGGLDALLVYVDLPGKHPLVVLTHGTSRKQEERAEVTPWAQLPQAVWFARRGWVVLVVVRRGYGSSGGDPDTRLGHCPQTAYEDAGRHSAEDLRIAIDYARTLPQVDGTRILAAGVSTGGFATVALTAQAPPGLVAGISFAGGRGSQADNEVCNPDELIRAYGDFGRHSRLPMLWIYAQNDKYFWPALAQQFDAAFRKEGGQDQFVLAPPLGDDGHFLYHRISAWAPTVDDFLKTNNLVLLPDLLPEPAVPDIPAPPGLSEQGLKAFHTYLALGPDKAFAVSPHSFGFSAANMNPGEARKKALDNCKQRGHGQESCKVVFVNNAAVSR